ncbi:Membrane protein involved in ER to Golgi transport (ISS) [Achlya hypogyna]|uniref:Vesicle transport protein n=1 Tax=Achlya hypogyna TaxID=1202772 RepID=A0A1V9YM05_ACHHY|nr:Membrane protein involved in ER to Golgi transport (ISS) [Achlya hypogyna]
MAGFFFSNSTPRAELPVVAPAPQDDVDEDVKVGCPSMSYENRLYACAACMAVGTACALFSLIFLALAQIPGFAVMYSIGSLCGLLSTMFLVGPARQLANMFAKHRWVASALYLGLIVLTLIVAFSNLAKPARVILVLIFVVLQFLAAIWYSLSYIPYARKVVSKALGGAGDCLFK